MLPKWEYKEIKLNPLSSLQKETRFKRMGKDGWELVSVSDGIAYFKRKMKWEDAADSFYDDNGELIV